MSKKIGKAPPKNWLEKLNDQYAFVLEGGDVRIFTAEYNPELGHKVVTSIKVPAFKALYDNRLVELTPPGADKPKLIPQGTAWCKHAGRRTYEKGTTLNVHNGAPDGYYNMWQGWGVEPASGDWSLMKWHLEYIVCDGDHEAYEYLLGWMARAVQKPEMQGETAIVMRGLKGSGKGTLGKVLIEIFGCHSLHLTKSDQLVGRFNAHLRAALLVFADEAFFAGDRKHEGSLKALITERYVTIEPKGVDMTTSLNRTHIIMATNSDWAVPATADERRFLVVDISDEKREDMGYFNDLNEELDNGGKAAMLHDLLKYDISKFNVRVIPQTAGLLSQKVLSLKGTDAWLYDCLQNGSIEGAYDRGSDREYDWDENGAVVPLGDVYDAFKKHASKYRCARDIPLRDVWSKRIRSIITVTNSRPKKIRSLRFEPLETSRVQFEKYIGHEIDWSVPMRVEEDDDGDKTNFPEIKGANDDAA